MNSQVLQTDQLSGFRGGGHRQYLESQGFTRKDVYDTLCDRIDAYYDLYLTSGGIDNRKRAERLERQALRFRDCGQNMVLFKCSRCEQQYAGFSRCESRICPDCTKKYASALWHRAKLIMDAYPPSGNMRWMLLTLTVRAEESAVLKTADFKRLTKDARKLINSLYPKDRGAGAIAAIEVGRGKNLHIHALVYGEYHAQSFISRSWLKITGTSKIVDIRMTDRPGQSLRYIIKYIAKPPKFETAGDLAEYLDAICGVRRVHTYGIFYNHKLLKRLPVECPICGGRLRYRGIDPGQILPPDTLLFCEAYKEKVAIN